MFVFIVSQVWHFSHTRCFAPPLSLSLSLFLLNLSHILSWARIRVHAHIYTIFMFIVSSINIKSEFSQCGSCIQNNCVHYNFFERLPFVLIFSCVDRSFIVIASVLCVFVALVDVILPQPLISARISIIAIYQTESYLLSSEPHTHTNCMLTVEQLPAKTRSKESCITTNLSFSVCWTKFRLFAQQKKKNKCQSIKCVCVSMRNVPLHTQTRVRKTDKKPGNANSDPKKTAKTFIPIRLDR